MNSEFCKECNNMLYPKEDNTDSAMMLICKSCENVQESTTNRLCSTYFKSRNVGYKSYAKALAHDPTLPKIKMNCKECGNNVVVYFQNKDIEEEVAFDLAYICTKCYNYWTRQ